MKIKDFWKLICEEHGYRFFSGVPCERLKLLYKTMSPDFMHFIPATKSDVALGIVSGAVFTGKKACLLIDDIQITQCYLWLNIFVYRHDILPLIIVATNNYEEILKTIFLPYQVLDDSFIRLDEDTLFLFVGSEALK